MADDQPTDHVAYLRGYAGGGIPGMHAAADEIERLQAALAGLHARVLAEIRRELAHSAVGPFPHPARRATSP